MKRREFLAALPVLSVLRVPAVPQLAEVKPVYSTGTGDWDFSVHYCELCGGAFYEDLGHGGKERRMFETTQEPCTIQLIVCECCVPQYLAEQRVSDRGDIPVLRPR